MESSESEKWGDNFSTVVIRRADSERLKKLRLPRKIRRPGQRTLECKYEVITHALDLLEKMRTEETDTDEDQRKVLG